MSDKKKTKQPLTIFYHTGQITSSDVCELTFTHTEKHCGKIFWNSNAAVYEKGLYLLDF